MGVGVERTKGSKAIRDPFLHNQHHPARFRHHVRLMHQRGRGRFEDADLDRPHPVHDLLLPHRLDLFNLLGRPHREEGVRGEEGNDGIGSQAQSRRSTAIFLKVQLKINMDDDDYVKSVTHFVFMRENISSRVTYVYLPPFFWD